MKDIDILKNLLDGLTDSKVEDEKNKNHLLNTLIELIGGFSIIKKDGTYGVVNESYAGTCGYTPNELSGNPWSMTVYKDDLPEAMNAFNAMIKDGYSIFTFQGIKKGGEIFKKKITLIKKLDLNGEYDGHYCFMGIA